ncbi:MAG: hypothetical protein AAGF49_04570 [Pseudomonadota bacterium]
MSIATITRSLTGAAQLFLGRKEGLALLDRSVDGFWRSFQVIFLLAPLTAITVFALTRADPSLTFWGIFTGQMVVVAAGLVLYPVLLALAAKPLGVSANYVSYIVARNWATPISAAIQTVPWVLFGAGWVPGEGAQLLTFIVLLIVLRYDYLILRIALQAPVGLAIALVIIEVLLAFLLAGVLG